MTIGVGRLGVSQFGVCCIVTGVLSSRVQRICDKLLNIIESILNVCALQFKYKITNMVRRKSDSRARHIATQGKQPNTRVLVARARNRARVLKEIRYLRNSVMLLIPKSPFVRLVKEIITDLFPNSPVNRMKSAALEALQEAAEAYIVQYFEDCVLLSLHAKRVTLQLQDMILMRRLRGRDDVINK